MKTIAEIIKEELSDSTKLEKLVVKWDGPDELFIQVPESYGESDTQIYLDDTLLKKFPVETSEESMGKNFKEITDEYFEYESMEATQGTSQKADIEWDDHYDQSVNGTNMIVVRVRGIKYCVTFDKFTIEKKFDNDDEIREFLFDFFNGLGTDTEDKQPFEIVLNKENITWK